MNRLCQSLVAATVALSVTSCGSMRVKPPASQPTAAVAGATLWERPSDLARRDLFYGPWGSHRAPVPDAEYTLVEVKHTGVNLGMTVRDAQGREWSVKQTPPGGLDREGSVEVVVSRLLSAVGYHQPPVYFLPEFSLKDDWGTHTELGGRFRLKDESLSDKGLWSWQENPFTGSQPYQGLLVLMMMFNSTDMKNSNNTLYEHRNGERVEQWYVVRDVGSALGDSNRLTPLKGDAEAFEREPYILGVSNGFVDFAYRAWYRNLVRDRITANDVRLGEQSAGATERTPMAGRVLAPGVSKAQRPTGSSESCTRRSIKDGGGPGPPRPPSLTGGISPSLTRALPGVRYGQSFRRD